MYIELEHFWNIVFFCVSLSLSLSLSLPCIVRKLKLSIEPAFSFFVFLSSYLLPHVIFYNFVWVHRDTFLADNVAEKVAAGDEERAFRPV